MSNSSNILKITALCVLGLGLAACGSSRTDRALSGGAIGAGAGALTGAATGGSAIGGAVLGGAAGAAIGGLTDKDDINLDD